MAVKGNNIIASGHFHKDWQKFIKIWFNQPFRKLRRRMVRTRKALKVAPKPEHLLRPAVRCPTIRYHTKLKLGRGFTLDELRRVGLNPRFARSIGIAVDHRRRNKSVESLLYNVQRLKEYKVKLILFPTKNAKKVKKEEASDKEQTLATQLKTVPIPLKKSAIKMKARIVTDYEKTFCAFATLRAARAEVRLVGIQEKKRKEAAEGVIDSQTSKRKGRRRK